MIACVNELEVARLLIIYNKDVWNIKAGSLAKAVDAQHVGMCESNGSQRQAK